MLWLEKAGRRLGELADRGACKSAGPGMAAAWIPQAPALPASLFVL